MIDENRLGEFGKQFLEEAVLSETGSIEITAMLGNIHIQIGSSFAHEIESHDEHGKNALQETLYQLEQLYLVKSIDGIPKIYKITDLGKKYVQ
jgi:hypothetical protein